MNKEQIYDERINPLMAQIIEICREHDISFVFSAQLTTDEEDKDGAMFCSTFHLSENAHDCLKKAASIIYLPRPETTSIIVSQ